MRKKYKTIKEQINVLKTIKNVDYFTIDKHCFYEKSYIDLITPFTDLIAINRDDNRKHVYDSSIDFQEYIEYNVLDFSISSALQMLIGNFEKQFKCFLSHAYCKKMKNNGDKYAKDYGWISDYKRNLKVFDLLKLKETCVGGIVSNADKTLVKRRKDLLDEIIEKQNPNNNNYLIKHYLTKYGYVPFFVVVHSLSLGKLLTLFGMLNHNDKNEFLCIFNNNFNKRYSDYHIEKFEKDILRIHVMRNIVNHYESIFPFFNNTKSAYFISLIDLIKSLKRNFDNCRTIEKYTFSFNKTHRSRSSYSLEFHLKIEKVIDALK